MDAKKKMTQRPVMKWSKKNLVYRRWTQRMVCRRLRKSTCRTIEEPVQPVSSAKALCSSTGRIVWPEKKRKKELQMIENRSAPGELFPARVLTGRLGEKTVGVQRHGHGVTL